MHGGVELFGIVHVTAIDSPANASISHFDYYYFLCLLLVFSVSFYFFALGSFKSAYMRSHVENTIFGRNGIRYEWKQFMSKNNVCRFAIFFVCVCVCVCRVLSHRGAFQFFSLLPFAVGFRDKCIWCSRCSIYYFFHSTQCNRNRYVHEEPNQCHFRMQVIFSLRMAQFLVKDISSFFVRFIAKKNRTFQKEKIIIECFD